MQLVRQQMHELLSTIYQWRESPELRKVLELAKLSREEVLKHWEKATGEDLVRYQTEYRIWGTIIKAITKPPLEAPKRFDETQTIPE